MTDPHRPRRDRPLLTAAVLVAGLGLAGCAGTPGDFDWDLRDGGAGLDTTEAARSATAAPPRADERGVLSYPTYQVAVARQGDTVATVAGRVGLGAQELASYNARTPQDTLRAGEILALPRRVAEPAVATASPGVATGVNVSAIATTALDEVDSTAPARSTAPATPGPEPVRHRVARGETAFSIARTYNVSPKALAEWNGLGSDLAVREGQYLIIPTALATAPDADAGRVAVTKPGVGTATPEPPSAAKPLPDENPAASGSRSDETPASPDLATDRTAASAAAFAMPVAGSIIRGYEKKKNDGIDIAAAAGSPVKAAADGTVAAITKDTDQTTIIVVRHPDNLLTVYAGVEGVSVAKGDAVKRGQAMAKVSGGTPTALHFEVRRGIDSLDPMTFLQ
jgi:murein DD-endopeptidase MepM/ murein hydrolase activator NlpD